MKQFQVPVMVTVQADDDAHLDSAQVAEFIHDVLYNGFSWDGCNITFSEAFAVSSFDGIPSDPDDPNSPPVAGETL